MATNLLQLLFIAALLAIPSLWLCEHAH